MFKINNGNSSATCWICSKLNKDIRTTPMTYSSGVSIVDFKQANASWVRSFERKSFKGCSWYLSAAGLHLLHEEPQKLTFVSEVFLNLQRQKVFHFNYVIRLSYCALNLALTAKDFRVCDKQHLNILCLYWCKSDFNVFILSESLIKFFDIFFLLSNKIQWKAGQHKKHLGQSIQEWTK